MHKKSLPSRQTIIISIVVAAIVVVTGIGIWRQTSRTPQRASIYSSQSTQTDTNSDSQPSNTVTYEIANDGTVKLTQLGVSIKIPTDLAQQKLVGVEFGSTNEYESRVAFTTEELRNNNQACDGKTSWIAQVTRYAGSAATMSEHVHGSTTLDFPDFHLAYETPSQNPCTVQSRETYDAQELKKETEAAKGLWDAILQAVPITQ
jgi:hypothetical protein